MKTLLIPIAFYSSLSLAAGSIPVDDPKLQSYFARSELVSSLMNSGLSLENCQATRLGRHWRYLAGMRIGPYQCTGTLNLKPVNLTIETMVEFLDEFGNRTSDDQAFELATDVIEKPITFKIQEETSL